MEGIVEYGTIISNPNNFVTPVLVLQNFSLDEILRNMRVLVITLLPAAVAAAVGPFPIDHSSSDQHHYHLSTYHLLFPNQSNS
jgi:hypothetical protein